MSNTTQHTPGPWHCGEGVARHIVYDATGWAVATVTDLSVCRRSGDNEATAQLIAAAPDLLEALEALVYGTENFEPFIAAAKEAIKKAGGKSCR